MGKMWVESRVTLRLVRVPDSPEENVPEELEDADGEHLESQTADHDVGAGSGGVEERKRAGGNTTTRGLQGDGDDVAGDEDGRVRHGSQGRELLAVDQGELSNNVIDPGHHEAGRQGETHQLQDKGVEVHDVDVRPHTAAVAEHLQEKPAGPGHEKPPLVGPDPEDDLAEKHDGVHHQERDVPAERGVVTGVEGVVVEDLLHGVRGLSGLSEVGRGRGCGGCDPLQHRVVVERGLRLDQVVDERDRAGLRVHRADRVHRRRLVRLVVRQHRRDVRVGHGHRGGDARQVRRGRQVGHERRELRVCDVLQKLHRVGREEDAKTVQRAGEKSPICIFPPGRAHVPRRVTAEGSKSI